MSGKAWICNGVEFKEGDRVRVMRQEEDYAENGMGNGRAWCNNWVGENDEGEKGMDAYLGLEFEIAEITSCGAIFVSPEIGYAFPLTSLERIS